jgi:hypothetical protein
VRGSRVTASLMPLLGMAPRIGRPFTPAEDLDGTAPVAILSDGLWRRRFGADPRALGRTIQINGESRTIVGVMPRGASLPGPLAENSDLWLPARMSPAERTNEDSHNYRFLARLAPGTTLEQASAEIDAFASRMAAERPSPVDRARLVPIGEQTVRAIRPSLLLIAGCVGLLLLVASANASTLLLARVQPAARVGGANRARCDQRTASLAGGRRVVVFACLAGWPGCSSAAGRCARCCRCLPARCPQPFRSTSTRARRSSRRPSPPSSDCRSASSSHSIGRAAGSLTC